MKPFFLRKNLAFLILFFGIFVAVFSGVLMVMFSFQSRAEPIKNPIASVKSATSGPTKTPTSSPTPTSLPAVVTQPKASPTIKLSKPTYTIAVFGDSMVDTMGDVLEYLEVQLIKKYPGTKFKLYNYGIGAQNVSLGKARFSSPYSYMKRSYPPITSISADVIILGTFAYNPYDPHDSTRHYMELKELVEIALKTGSDVYILVEIAPLGETFGKGEHGVNLPPDQARAHAMRIIEQLDNGFVIGRELGVPVIDANTPTRSSGKFGEDVYVNPSDGIHPSEYGHVFTAKKIAETIKLH